MLAHDDEPDRDGVEESQHPAVGATTHQQQQLRRAMALLHVNESTVIRSHVEDGLSFDDIAVVHNWPTWVVENFFTSGMAKLREYMQ